MSDIIKEATDEVRASLTDVVVSADNGLNLVKLYDIDSERFLGVEPKDNESITLEFVNEQDRMYVFNSLANSLKKSNFSEYSTDNWPGEYSTKYSKDDAYDPHLWLSKNDYLCNINTTRESSYLNVYLGCVDTDTIRLNAAETKPFYDAFVNSLKSKDQNSQEYFFVVDAPGTIVKNDKYPGYEVSGGGVLGVDGGATGVVWYRKDGAEWVFGYDHQSTPGCAEFDTIDMQKAFYDQLCYDYINNEGPITVGSYYNL